MTGSDSVRPAPHLASSADSVEAVLEEFLNRCSRPSRLLVALSGGGDSVGLLTALARMRARLPEAGCDLIAATVDHGLRPGSRDEAIAAGRLSESLGIPHAVLAWTGDKPRSGVQAKAREARYQLLTRHALSRGADLVLTGHNLEDNVETHRMRLARNRDGEGHGMADAVLLFGKMWAARPLLGLRREVIRDYLRRQGVCWAEDPSNDNPIFERVRLRLERQALEAPDFAALTHRRSARFRAAAKLLESRAAVIGLKVGVVELADLSSDHPALLDAVLALAALLGGREHMLGQEGGQALRRFLAAGAGQLTIGRCVFDRRGDRLYLQRERRGLPAVSAAPGEAALWDNRLRITNIGGSRITVGADSAGDLLVDADLFDPLPARVRQLALSTGPVVTPKGAKSPEIEPFLPGCDRFLPLERLELGNVLANLMGLPHFPTPIFRHQARN